MIDVPIDLVLELPAVDQSGKFRDIETRFLGDGDALSGLCERYTGHDEQQRSKEHFFISVSTK